MPAPFGTPRARTSKARARLGAPVLLIFLRKWHYAWQPKLWGLQIVRSALLFAATATFLFALKTTPWVVANTIGFLTPILTVLLAALLLGERLDAVRIAAVIIGFAGALTVMRPGSVGFSWTLLLPAATALCYSLYTLATRRPSADVSPYATLLWTPMVGSIFGTLAASSEFGVPEASGLAELIALGLASLVGHLFAIKAYGFQLRPYTDLQCMDLRGSSGDHHSGIDGRLHARTRKYALTTPVEAPRGDAHSTRQ